MSSFVQSANIFFRAKHVDYFLYCSKLLPHHYVQLDSSRLTALYFIVVALDMLNSLNKLSKDQIIDYVYMMQLKPKNEFELRNGCFGFIGSPFLGVESVEENSGLRIFQQGHLAMTHTALMILLSFEDDLHSVDRKSIGEGLRLLQQEDGTFLSYHNGGENDMRYVYCACSIASILNLWEYCDKKKICDFIRNCQTYEGGFGLHPGSEAQGGATYCAIASLVLMGELENTLDSSRINQLSTWCQQKQNNGYQGRTNKLPDSCYSFWVGGTLALMSQFDELNMENIEDFLCGSCQHQKMGGFSKYPGDYPDIIHSFYSLATLSLAKIVLQDSDGNNTISDVKLQEFDPRFGICKERVKFHFGI